MKHFSILILRFTIFVAGAIVLALCCGVVWLALGETINPSSYSSLSHTLLAGVCSASIPYFIALYQAYKLLGYIDTNTAFSELSVKALTTITRCAFVDFAICALGGLPFFYRFADIEDAPGLVIIGMIITCVALVIAVFASVLNRLLQDAVKLKSEKEFDRELEFSN